jgi:DNA-binding transcriptional ArsR family regulator
MVVDTDSAAWELDRLFHALSDATRRDIVVRAAGGELSVSALARHYPMSTTAVQKHVAVLESVGLVKRRRHGREQLVTTRPERLAAARRAIDELEELWRARLERFGDVLADPSEGEHT